ncbi:unnamed protein product [Rotaria sordida]|uniref:DH domain-containing protein n=2 Tax=Rotaria sordida TaxID=392033 RepID=A0A814R8B7_9BILA|nr:unnamed protein product [Rotaria sordida]CAF1482063.1 unnamed protein product [Rotaria sordida]
MKTIISNNRELYRKLRDDFRANCKLKTERTYKKDIEVIAEIFRHQLMFIINQQQDLYNNDEYNFENGTLIHLSDVLFTHLLPIYNFHIDFLRQRKQRISIWKTRSISGNEHFNVYKITQQIGDLIEILPRYEHYIENYDRLLSELEYVLKHNRRFDIIYKEFESEKFCYLSFLFKPLQRLLHYEYLFEKLLIYYKNNNCENEYHDCYGVFIKIQDLIENFTDSLKILFSDVLFYCARSSSPILQFKLHGELPLRTMIVTSSENLQYSLIGALEDNEQNQIDRSGIQHRANTTMHNDFPLTSLPLLVYRSSIPSENDDDDVNKDFVFKLQFKNHVYFFRAESQWMDVVSSATTTSTSQ